MGARRGSKTSAIGRESDRENSRRRGSCNGQPRFRKNREKKGHASWRAPGNRRQAVGELEATDLASRALEGILAGEGLEQLDPIGGCVAFGLIVLIAVSIGKEGAGAGSLAIACRRVETEVADLVKALREDVEQEAAKEFDRTERALIVVARAESDGVVAQGDDPSVGDGDAVGVAAEILEDVGRTSEGRLDIDDPAPPLGEGPKKGAPQIGIQRVLFLRKAQFSFRA